MTSDGEPLPPGATPLDPDEAEGLLQVHIETRKELNEAEEANIAAGFAWAIGRLNRRDPLADDYVFELHRRMFDQVWAWAGRTRLTEKNIGVAPWEIRSRIRDLVDDARLWREALRNGKPIYSITEVAVRLHHRLVAIHPFPNGNGRHARMMADLLMLHAGLKPVSWGQGIGSLLSTGALRDRYIISPRYVPQTAATSARCSSSRRVDRGRRSDVGPRGPDRIRGADDGHVGPPEVDARSSVCAHGDLTAQGRGFTLCSAVPVRGRD